MGRHKTVTDEDVLAAARRVFEEKGHAATTRDVARAAGISQAVLYQRFATKDDLFLAAMAPPPLDLAKWLCGGAPATREIVKSHVRDIGRGLVAYLDEVGPALLQLATHPFLRPQVISEVHGRMGAEEVMSALDNHLSALCKQGLIHDGSNPRAAAEALIAFAHGAVLPALLIGTDAGSSSVARFDSLFEALWTGLRTEAAA